MKVHVDREADALYLRLTERPIFESEEIKPGVILDYDWDGTVVGVEFLNISRRMSTEEMHTLQFASP